MDDHHVSSRWKRVANPGGFHKVE